jgi:putative ABC transport system permease protein
MIDQPVTVSTSVALGSLVVSLAIGATAGVYPAARAARLTPIDALRTP